MNSPSSNQVPPAGRLGYEAFAAFREDPAKFLTDVVNTYVLTAPTNWSAPFGHPYFAAPVAIAFGDGDSEEFLEIKRKYPWTVSPRESLESPPRVGVATVTKTPRSNIVMPGKTHASCIDEEGNISWPNGEPSPPPWDAFSPGGGGTAGGDPSLAPVPNMGPPPPPSPERVTCIALGLPVHPDVLAAEASYPWGSSPELKVHSLWGAHLGFTLDISNYIVKTLQMLGYSAISPYHTTWGSEFTMDFQYEGPTSYQPVSACPERHWAAAAGLGTFGLSDMIITERGMAVILNVIMTSAFIPPSPKPTQEHCLFFRDGSCRQCIDRCPGQAISADSNPPGRVSAKCEAGVCAAAKYNETYLMDRMLSELGDYAGMGGNLSWEGIGMGMPIASFRACGRCFTDVPCSTRIPD
jgi:hypothetical protein